MTPSPSLLAEFVRRFACRTDVYYAGWRKPTGTKFAYALREEPLTEAVVSSHLRGDVQLAVLPIVDNNVHWMCVDFDAPKALRGSAGAYEAALAAARAQQAKFASVGIPSMLERSRSGEGVHVWTFFEEWMRAGDVRRVMLPLIDRDVTYDRIYPVQSEVSGGKFGNALALPYNGEAVTMGNSMFLDDAGEPVSLADFLAAPPICPMDVFERLLAEAPSVVEAETALQMRLGGKTAVPILDGITSDGRPERPLTGWLKVISPFGCRAMRLCAQHPEKIPEPLWYVMLGQTTCFQHGRELAHQMSVGHPDYSPEDTNAKYNHALENPPHGCAYIHEHWPKLACPGCPGTAPYHLAKRPMLELSLEGESMARRGGFTQHMKRVLEVDAGRIDPGVSLGYPELDSTVRCRRSELMILGAAPSIGKTAFMVDSSFRQAAAGVPTFVFSGETGRTGLSNRYLSRVAKVDSRALRGERIDPQTGGILRLSADELERLQHAAKVLDDLPLFTDYQAVQPEQILASLERGLIKQRVDFRKPYVIWFDYLQFGGVEDGETLEQRTARVSQQLKALAKITDQCTISFSQLQRQAEGVDEPQLTWFRGSGRIEQDADVAGILWGPRSPSLLVRRSLMFLKQREGEVGKRFYLEFDKPHSYWTVAQPPASKVISFELDIE